jgi:uncharacterized protein YjbI with pentapeptide repeats
MTGAEFGSAHLQGADLSSAGLQAANLSVALVQGADLIGAQLQGANLSSAHLQGADLSSAQLQGADLSSARLQGALLADAQLQGANLIHAQLQGAMLSVVTTAAVDIFEHDPPVTVLTGRAQLQGADLIGAELQGADVRAGQFQGVDLRAARLQGALMTTELLREVEPMSWSVQLNDVQWDLADLRGSSVQPMTASDVDALIIEATKGIPDEGRRSRIVELLTAALRIDKRPVKPDFPEEWRSAPNVMFEPSDPEPEPFSWGRPMWATEHAYDQDLAKFVGDPACGTEVPEPQTRGLARRAIATSSEADRLWPRLFAARLIGPRCPPAKRLPDYMRRQLEELAAQGDAAVASPASPPDPAE